MGEFQEAIRDQFPESALIIKKTITIVSENQKPEEDSTPGKLWQFKSVRGDILNVEFNSLSIVSEHYKTYELGEGDKFRDLIETVGNKFIDIMKIPIIKRIGLRYIDECPFPSREHAIFKRHYNSAFPLSRFNLEDVSESLLTIVTRKGDCNLRYVERIVQEGGVDKFYLDFDGFSLDLDSSHYLDVTDKLHLIISEEYEKTLKTPVYKYMRKKPVK